MATSPEGTCQSDLPVFSDESLKQILKVSRIFVLKKEHAKQGKRLR